MVFGDFMQHTLRKYEQVFKKTCGETIRTQFDTNNESVLFGEQIVALFYVRRLVTLLVL